MEQPQIISGPFSSGPAFGVQHSGPIVIHLVNLLNFERACHNCNQDFLLTALFVCHGLSLLAAFAVAIRPGPDMGKSKDINCTGFWLSLMPMPDIQTTSQSPLSLSVVLFFLFLKLV